MAEDSSRRIMPRSQSAIQAHRGDVPSKHDEYLIQLQERNRLIKAYHNQRQPKDQNLKKRETGFQLYLNGAHSARKQRPGSILNGPSNRMTTPSPYFADFSFPTPSNTTVQTNNPLPTNGRRRWTPTTKTKIKTADGSIIADIDQTSLPSNNPPLPHSKSLFHQKPIDLCPSKRAVQSAGTPSEALPKSAWGDRVIELNASQIKAIGQDDLLPFSHMQPKTVDQSWMPTWFTKTTTTTVNEPDYDSDFEESSSTSSNEDHQLLNRVSLSVDDIPSLVKLSVISNEEKNSSEQQTASLVPAVEMHRRDLPKNPMSNRYTAPRPGETRPGARRAGGNLMKNSNNQSLFLVGTKGKGRVIDSIDFENYLQPKEVHIDSEDDDDQHVSNRRSPFRDPVHNDRSASQTDWLENSISQIDLFSRRHRGMLEHEKIEEYFSHNASKHEYGNDEEHFTIPELPTGEQLVFNLKSTWGDRHYIGLNGIEIFSSEGELVKIRKITADPADINILPEYGHDPRVVGNLIDGVNRTRDDIHMWLAPFTLGRNHFIYITFEEPVEIAMIRIWNYNKNRIHSARGAKDVEIALNGRLIFKGEISQACGNVNTNNDPSAYGETILFTTDGEILERISGSDEMYVDQEAAQDDMDNASADNNRPPTAGTDVRPMTRAMLRRPFTATRAALDNEAPEYYGKRLVLTITETWGDQDYYGLTGIEVVDINDADCVIQSYDARPRDPTSLDDIRTLEKLFDSENVTCDERHMWLCPYSRKERNRIMINLSVSKRLHGLRIWNYNKSPEDTYCGVKRLHVQLNDKIISPKQGFLLRRAPGHCYFDFAQEIVFAHAKTLAERSGKQQQNRSTAQASRHTDSDISMPNGFIYEFQLHSAHGDAYYIGLNGLEFYDEQGEQIGLTEQNIAAYPHSVNSLNTDRNNEDDDARTPENLIDGENDYADGSHCWIAPILPNIINRIFVIFDRPTSISMIKIWNYAKTPSRGVREFSLLVDDLLVWTGMLDKIKEDQVPFNTILFSDERILTEHEKHTVLENKNASDNPSGQTPYRDENIDYSKRPTTSFPRNPRKR